MAKTLIPAPGTGVRAVGITTRSWSTAALGLQFLPTLIKPFDGPLRFLQSSASIGQRGVASRRSPLDFGLLFGHFLFGGSDGCLHSLPLLLLAVAQLARLDG